MRVKCNVSFVAGELHNYMRKINQLNLTLSLGELCPCFYFMSFWSKTEQKILYFLNLAKTGPGMGIDKIFPIPFRSCLMMPI